MEQEEIKNAIIERFNNLQPEIRNIILDENYDKTLYNISQKYKMTPEQVQDFELNTTLVLLGQTHPNDYEKELKEDIKLPKETIENIVQEVKEQILKNIYQTLKDNFTKDDEEEAKLESFNKNSKTKTLDPRFSSLPQEVQDAIALSDYQKKLYEISTKNKLPIDMMSIVEDITVKLLNGKISPSQYENEIAIATDLPPTKVKEIANDVNESIMKNIREHMKNPNPIPIPEQKVVNNTIPQTETIKPKIEIPTEDIVPIPPYATKDEQKDNLNIYKDAGIEVIGNESYTKKTIENIKTDNNTNSGLSLEEVNVDIDDNKKAESIKEVIREIPKIVTNKLSSVTASSNITSDYTLPKIKSLNELPSTNNTSPMDNSLDVYRETI